MLPSIAIIRDGKSDFFVLRKFVKAIYEHHHLIELQEEDFLEFETLNITNALSEYMAKAELEKYALFGDFARDFRKQLSSILFTAFQKFGKEKDKPLTNRDILILNADAERILGKNQHYFEDWAYTVNSILWLAIEEFYHKMVENSYQYENMPLILPLVLFPSSEILVAACMYDFNKEAFRKFDAKPVLKHKVYETENIHIALENGKLREVLDTFLVPESLKSIYQSLPEARKFMQIMTFSPLKNE